MAHNRYYLRPIKEGPVTVTGSEAHHMRRVRRVAKGDRVELFDGVGLLARARVTSVTDSEIGLNCEKIDLVQPRAKGRIVLAVSLAKNDRFEWLISKCTELGVDHICPILFNRTVKLATGKNVLERYEKLLIAAAKQSGRLFLPIIDPAMVFTDSVTYLSQTYPDSRWLIGSLDRSTPYLLDLPQEQQDTVVYVGPEGDLTTEETQLLVDKSARAVRLLDSILRVETAGIAFVTLLAARRCRKIEKE
jgi:16S rRNA (uracil1498-N3)-methyltransferase